MRDMGVFSSIGKTIFGIGGSFLSLTVGSIMLITNEMNFKRTGDAIAEAESVVVEMADVNVLDDGLEGKLVYGVSLTQTEDILRDDIFDVSVNGIKLIREVNYYQLVETKHEEVRTDSDGNDERIITYTYDYKWTKEPINSSKFNTVKYRSTNWVRAKIDTMTVWANLVGWGAYELPNFLKYEIGGDVAPIQLEISEEIREKWERVVETTSSSHTASALVKAKSEYVHVDGNTIYFGPNSSSPVVGDVRIRLNYIPPGRDLSVIAQVEGNTFTKYKAKNRKEYFSVKNGNLSLTQMIEDDKSSNTSMAWILRVVFTILIIVGIRLLLLPINAFASKIPVFGNIVNVGIAFISLMVGLIWSLVVIALAWLFLRPLISMIMLSVIIALIILIRKKVKRRAA